VNVTGLYEYEIIIREIKKASFEIHANQIGNTAKGLEKAASLGEVDYVAMHNPPFLKTAHVFLNRLEASLDRILMNYYKPVKDKPDDELLHKLLTACNNYDIKGADEIMEEMDQYQYESESELIDWLRENIEITNFAEIELKLEHLR